MPPVRNEEEYQQKRQQIIDGALAVFAEKGFVKATNRDIASAAGIGSPGLIYHYFENKTALLHEAVASRSPALQLLLKDDSLHQMPPREALTLIGSTMLETFLMESNIAALRIILGEAIREPRMAELFNVVGPMRGFEAVSRYLAAQMEAGTLRRMDVGAAARCFLGPIVVYFLTREVFPQADALALSRQTMVETAVDVFLQGMLP